MDLGRIGAPPSSTPLDVECTRLFGVRLFLPDSPREAAGERSWERSGEPSALEVDSARERAWEVLAPEAQLLERCFGVDPGRVEMESFDTAAERAGALRGWDRERAFACSTASWIASAAGLGILSRLAH